MDTSFSLRIDGNAKQWGGNNSPQGDRQNRRRQKLQALLQALKAGEMDAARLAFTALINFDPSISSDPYCTRLVQRFKAAIYMLPGILAWNYKIGVDNCNHQALQMQSVHLLDVLIQ